MVKWHVENLEKEKCQVHVKYFHSLKIISIIKIWLKKKISALVTTGPTREYIDPVRYISNESSGKQGYEIALALSKLGVKTTLVAGPTSINFSKDINIKK